MALLAALPLVVAGATGVLLAYHAPIERWLEPELFAIEPSGEPLELAEVVAVLRRAAPRATLHHVGVPDGARPYLVYASEPAEQGRQHYMLFVDPYSGEVHKRVGGGLMKTVERLHRNLLLGSPARYYVAISTIALILLSLVGLYLWWPMRGSTVQRFLRRRDALAWHNVTALLTLPVMLIIAFTGVTLTFHKAVIPAVHALTFSDPLPEPPTLQLAAPAAVTLSDALARVREALPGARITGFADRAPDKPYVVRVRYPGEWHPVGWEQVLVHPGSGAILDRLNAYEHSPGAAFQHSWWAWHTGEMLGAGGRLFWSVSSAVLVLLAGTGVWLWARRRRWLR